MEYQEFLNKKTHLSNGYGFNPTWIPDFLFDFQKELVIWAIRQGRSAIFADCGMGKTPMQLVWAQNVVEKTNKPVLILTPLAVSFQTVEESNKFGVIAKRSSDGKINSHIVVSNYERLKYFNPDDFGGVVCDESSILKNFKGAIKNQITEFMRKIPYRLLCTATAAPNDYIELGTSSEVLGDMGYMDMLNRFFKNDQNNSAVGRLYGDVVKWRFKGHAEQPFWRWVCSWARAIRKPSDLGFNDDKFNLPELTEIEHVIKTDKRLDGMLFAFPAVGLKEEREERRETIEERCEKVYELVRTNKQAIIWCHLNNEGDLLEKLIPDSVQISGSDTDDKKEQSFIDFANNKIRVLITKPKIGAWGLNFQNCSHVIYFASHSYEQYYQAVRRCWRFGQTDKVKVDIVTSEGGINCLKNMKRKSQQADKMFNNLIQEMNKSLKINNNNVFTKKEEVPNWL